MIVVDSSVWIGWFQRHDNEQIEKLRHADPLRIFVPDLVLTEVLQGARTDSDARRIERELAIFGPSTICSPTLAIKAAENYRALRRRGITVRKTIDLIIGTFCIENGFSLLHLDRDFRPMAEHLGLKLI
ncbi:type II toxin-antitoxin system VapC family toxin [Gellertiella hungarica]|uniref:Ribonuclease VapC n=1 Tax=Gellertiella hungarica TaxID=1572859 RepID=A0A7W6NLQ1_9HYPH|nr:PIN domain nuclease [Gellertiella hungarica]MBB4065665.1 hypothetical protein [Gellertiella hungarica]